jgi:hypothetical protein
MKALDAVRLIQEVETRFAVDEWIVDEMAIWPLIRIGASFQLDHFAADKKHINLASQARACAYDVYATLKKRIFDQAHNADPNQEVDAVFLAKSVDRFLNVNGLAYNASCDPLVEMLEAQNIDCTVIESNFDWSYFKLPRFSPSLLIQPRLSWLGAKALLSSPKPSQIRSQLKGFDEMERFIRSQGISEQDLDFNSLLKRIRPVRLWAEEFKKYLRKLRPKAVFIVSYYGPLGQAMCLACQELGITSVDLQHGVQSASHCGYAAFLRLPTKGYALLPSHFWCWSQDDVDLISSWANQAHRAFVGSNPLLAASISNKTALGRSLSDTIKIPNDELSRDQNASRIINALITLQPVHDFTPLMREIMAQAPKNVRWWIRLHPAQRNELDRIETEVHATFPAALVRAATEAPLHALLKSAIDIHLTEASSVVLDAGYFDIPSILLDEVGVETYAIQIVRGIATPGLTAESAISQFNRFISHPRQQMISEQSPLSLCENALKTLLKPSEGLQRI